MAIEEGEAEVLRGGEQLADLGPGDFFGEMGLLEHDKPNATVVAKIPDAPDHARPSGTSSGWRRRCPSAAERIRAGAEARRPES